MDAVKVVFGLLLFAGLAYWCARPALKREDLKAGRFVATVAVMVGYLFLVAGFGQVPAGHRGVVLRFGAITGKIMNEGLYVITPFMNTVELMDVQTHREEAESTAASHDLQEVRTKIALNYSLDPAKTAYVYRHLQRDYVERVVRPTMEEAVKASTAHFNAEELITKRPLVKEEIESELRRRLRHYGIRVETVNITNFSFSESFEEAVEAKVTASQQALKAGQDLERIRREGEQRVVQAQAEADALRAQRQEITPELLELRRVEALRRAIEKWDGHMPSVLTGDGPVPVLNVFRSGAVGQQ